MNIGTERFGKNPRCWLELGNCFLRMSNFLLNIQLLMSELNFLLNTQLFLHISSDCRASNEGGLRAFKATIPLLLDAEWEKMNLLSGAHSWGAWWRPDLGVFDFPDLTFKKSGVTFKGLNKHRRGGNHSHPAAWILISYLAQGDTQGEQFSDLLGCWETSKHSQEPAN